MNIDPYRLVIDLIDKQGPISFDTFMELALYSDEGYYSNKSKVGAIGDYYTSPTLHPIFASFLSSQINHLWEYLGKPSPFKIVELGCGEGILAKDIINSLSASKNQIQDSLQYIAVDRIAPNVSVENVEFIQSDMPPSIGGTGIIISNELFDAFPVKRFEINSGIPHEILVSISAQNELIEIISSNPLPSSIVEYISKFDLPEGYRGVINPNLDPYFEALNKTLDKGFFLTFDYGYLEKDFYSLNRSDKHIQTYFKHVDGLNLFDNIGNQDITSQVNFTAVIDSGLRHGFEPVILMSQSKWMEDMGFRDVLEFQNLSVREIRLINSLVDIESLGGFFVSIQEKDVGTFDSSNIFPEREFVLDNLHVSPISKSHIAHQIKTQDFYGV